MIPTGKAKVGDRIVCPDGKGIVTQVFDPDNVMVKLDKGGLASFDIQHCARETDPNAEKVLS